MLADELPEELCGTRLDAVEELLFVPADESGPPMREAICFRFGVWSLLIRALTDTSELQVTLGELVAAEAEHRIRDASSDQSFQPMIGKSLRSWWQAYNHRGYADAFMLAFEPSQGLCLVAMDNTISVLQIAGDQWS